MIVDYAAARALPRATTWLRREIEQIARRFERVNAVPAPAGPGAAAAGGPGAAARLQGGGALLLEVGGVARCHGEPLPGGQAAVPVLAGEAQRCPAEAGEHQDRSQACEDLPSTDLVYDTQLGAQLEAADKQARQLGEQVARLRADKGAEDLLPFCKELIAATICNLLMPPCEGDGSERYRKPCRAFDLALQHGCNLTLPFGDLSFAEPPDCYDLPIRNYASEVGLTDYSQVDMLEDGFLDAEITGGQPADVAGASVFDP
ncbi:hypothetical protein T484DRAFT_1765158 [Baffinella frigidus]|nr:hypothetical protein T484DRAFT_1765158 [Cryptophyta sp. CCMP2293]